MYTQITLIILEIKNNLLKDVYKSCNVVNYVYKSNYEQDSITYSTSHSKCWDFKDFYEFKEDPKGNPILKTFFKFTQKNFIITHKA